MIRGNEWQLGPRLPWLALGLVLVLVDTSPEGHAQGLESFSHAAQGKANASIDETQTALSVLAETQRKLDDYVRRRLGQLQELIARADAARSEAATPVPSGRNGSLEPRLAIEEQRICTRLGELYLEQARLQERFSPAHPAIVEIDRQLTELGRQLAAIEAAGLTSQETKARPGATTPEPRSDGHFPNGHSRSVHSQATHAQAGPSQHLIEAAWAEYRWLADDMRRAEQHLATVVQRHSQRVVQNLPQHAPANIIGPKAAETQTWNWAQLAGVALVAAVVAIVVGLRLLMGRTPQDAHPVPEPVLHSPEEIEHYAGLTVVGNLPNTGHRNWAGSRHDRADSPRQAV